MLTEQDYEMIKMELLGVIKKGTRMEIVEAAKALAELEKAYKLSSIVDDSDTLDIKVYKY